MAGGAAVVALAAVVAIALPGLAAGLQGVATGRTPALVEVEATDRAA